MPYDLEPNGPNVSHSPTVWPLAPAMPETLLSWESLEPVQKNAKKLRLRLNHRSQEADPLICATKDFNKHFKPSTSRCLRAANQDFEKLLSALTAASAEMHKRYPIIGNFIKSCRPLVGSHVQDETRFVFNRDSLIDLAKYSQKLEKSFQSFWNRNSVFATTSSQHVAITPFFYDMYDNLVFFNNWLHGSPNNFELPALQAAELQLFHLIKSIQLPQNFKYCQILRWSMRAFITQFNTHIERQLEQQHLFASQLQTQHSLLLEQLANLEEKAHEQSVSTLANEIEQVLQNHTHQQDVLYKKALLDISVTIKTNKQVGESTALKSITTEIGQLITRPKNTPALPKSRVSSSSLKENDEVEPLPLITNHLLDLQALEEMNQQTPKLLFALENNTFWFSTANDTLRLQLIHLIKQFNDCFRSGHSLSVKNGCLQDLMVEIQRSPMLYNFETENMYDLSERLQQFIHHYGKILLMELMSIHELRARMSSSSLALQQKIQALKEQIRIGEQLQQTALPNVFHSQVLTGPYREAVLHIVNILLNSNDLYTSPQSIPLYLAVLERSFLVLSQAGPVSGATEERVEAYEASSSEAYPDAVVIEPTREALPWKSLEFLHEYTQILHGKYNTFAPQDSYWLGFLGWTDRRSNAPDRRQKYIDFCSSFKSHLTAFHQHFISMGAEKPLNDANASLQALVTTLTGYNDAMSNEFYALYQQELQHFSSPEAGFVFLEWEHLTKLHTASKKLLSEVQRSAELSSGYLTKVPLLIGAIQYFHHQFLLETILDNKHPDKTCIANKALSVIIHLIYRDRMYLDGELEQVKLQPFLILYNRYVKETIKHVLIGLQKSAYINEQLEQEIAEFENSTRTHQVRTAIMHNQIGHLMQEISKEPACSQALIILKKGLNSSVFEGFFQMEVVRPELPNPRKIPAFTPQLFKYARNVETGFRHASPAAEVTRKILFLTPSCLKTLNQDADLLLKQLDVWATKYEHLATIISNLERFNASVTDEEANCCLDDLMMQISYAVPFNQFNTEINWAILHFFSEYTQVITHYLQQLRLLEYQADERTQELTQVIDRLSQEEASQAPSRMIPKFLQDECNKAKPAEQAVNQIASMMFSAVKRGGMTVPMIPVLISIFKTIFATFEQPREILQRNLSPKTSMGMSL